MTAAALLIQVITLFQISAAVPGTPVSGPDSKSDLSPHGPMEVACQKCHVESAWRPIRKKPDFDHGKTGYPLRGLHVAVTCEECHAHPVFADVGRSCQDCHADIHRRKNGAQCDLCHKVSGWQVSLKDINAHQDRFPLIGAHAVADCYSCHRAGAVGQFNRQGLSTECDSCHLRAYQRTTAPNHQALGYSTDCQRCHASIDTWMIVGSTAARKRR